MNKFDNSKVKPLPLSERESKTSINSIIDPNLIPEKSPNIEKIDYIAEEIVKSKNKQKPIILFFGAHLIKNGLSRLLGKMAEEGYITHFATNGAGPIHDWEFAYQGKTEEDVRKYVQKGQFGTWDETGKYLNLAIKEGAKNNLGYGESIGKIILEDKIDNIIIRHPYKNYSLQYHAYKNNIPFTVHPSIGQDIIYTHPDCDFESIGKGAGIDFLKYVDSVSKLEGGVYLSVGSAIASPMVFEKALSMSRNVAVQENKELKDFMIVVNDIQKSGDWDWGKTEEEPPKDNQAYYLRFCKTFNRMGSREMHYVQEDNRSFLRNLHHAIKRIDK
jgi:hypothetical protein